MGGVWRTLENPSETETGRAACGAHQQPLVTDSAAQEENPGNAFHFLKPRSSRSSGLNIGWEKISKLRVVTEIVEPVCGKQTQQELLGAGWVKKWLGWGTGMGLRLGWGVWRGAEMAGMGMVHLPHKHGDLGSKPSNPTSR